MCLSAMLPIRRLNTVQHHFTRHQLFLRMATPRVSSLRDPPSKLLPSLPSSPPLMLICPFCTITSYLEADPAIIDSSGPSYPLPAASSEAGADTNMMNAQITPYGAYPPPFFYSAPVFPHPYAAPLV